MPKKTLLLISLFGLVSCSGDVDETSSHSGDQTEASQLEPTGVEDAPVRPLREGEKMAKCVIGPDQYSGPCVFQPQKGGTFSMSLRDDSEITPGVTLITVGVYEEGKADVRGLTLDGVNSRWGTAERSKDDPACWVGSDFSVCAY